MTGHWAEIARRWQQVGPPLRPSLQGIAFYTRAIADITAPRALILGVTPELYHLPWPAGANVIAADHTQDMIDAVWPGSRDAAICADWLELPLRRASRDIVLCDGGIHLLHYPIAHRQFVRTLGRILAPEGKCVLRLFVPPAKRESPDAVLDDFLAGKIPNLNLLKLRLAMAMGPSQTIGVCLADVWNAIHRVAPDLDKLASQIGWPVEHFRAIDTYRDCPARYRFLSLDTVREFFCTDPGGFECVAVDFPTYELGERCPTVVFQTGKASMMLTMIRAAMRRFTRK